MSISKILILLFVSLPLSCLAQFAISGRVLNQTNAKSVANASVFLSNATIGGKTADDGTFTLNNVKPGKYSLVISCIGFESYNQAIIVTNGNIKMNDFTIFPKSIGLTGVSIKPQGDPFRSNYYFLFKERFLGNSDLAKQCKILNPEILDFNYDNATKTLTASSPDFLEIENDALGYKIKYLLVNFTWDNRDTLHQKMGYEGSVLFEPMKGSPSQQKHWQKMRREVYEGSEMHFFRSVVASRIDEEGFRVMRQAIYANPDRPSDSLITAKIKYFKQQKPTKTKWKDSISYWTKAFESPKIFKTLIDFPLNKGDLIRPTDQRGLYALGCELDGLYVIYDHNHHFPENPKKMWLYNPHHIYNPNDLQSTLISFNEPFAFLDRNGSISNPYSISLDGRWTFNRVAELLPLDYEPSQMEDVQVDSTVYKNITARLNSFSKQHVAEKAYLHFDKPYYAAGDTMHFKAYLTSGERHQLSGISGVMHVGLINTDNKVDQSINLAVIGGVAWGDFALPDSLPKGGYRVVAYTNLMRNDDDRAYFDQDVPISAVLNNKVPESSTSNGAPVIAKPEIRFFPEGGEMVADVRSKVAFKAINNNGAGIEVKGKVIDNDNKEITTFTSSHLGMGCFYLAPQGGKTYKAKLIYADGTQGTIDLPAPNPKGITLSVNNDSLTQATIRIETADVYYRENRNKDYTLVIYSGSTARKVIIKLDNPTVRVDIATREFNTGIVRVTLFSPQAEPLSERLFFIQNDDQLNLTINSDATSYSKREKMNIKLYASDGGDATAGHFSVSVIDENKVPVNENAENTILTNLLLTSDLKGYVEQPNYYFINETNKTRNELDLVMLTHGYRKFEWKQVLDSTISKVNYQPETSLELSGVIKNPSGKPMAHAGITLLATRENVVRDTISDTNGNFKFTDLYLSDTAKVVLNARKTNNGNSNVKIEVTQPDYVTIEKMSFKSAAYEGIPTLVAESMQKQYELGKRLKNGIILKQLNIKSSANTAVKVELKHSSNLNGPGNADQVIVGDKLVGCPNLADCLVSRIHGTRVKYGSDGTPIFFSMRTPIAINGNTKPMAVLVDGIIRDQSALTEISNSDVASIEILETSGYLTIYGSSASGGLIIINTKHGDQINPSTIVEPGVITYRFNGFYKAREFYSPKYDHPVTDSTIPDLRTTIYWKPEVITDKDGNASFEYYNADGPGTYRVVVEGIDENGNIGRQVYRYKVQ